MSGERHLGSASFILCLAVLSDSSIISGDSHGNVQVWDGVLGVLSVTLHQHTAEILSLAVSADQSQIFASGIDSKVTCVQKLSHHSDMTCIGPNGEVENSIMLDQEDSNSQQWVYSHSHRPHSHDVYSLAICREGELEQLLSGGIDGKLCIYSVQNFAKTRPTWVLPIPSSGLVQSTADGQLLALKHQRCIDLWHVSINNSSDNEDCKVFASIQLRGEDHIGHVALAANGKFLALTTNTNAGLRLWSLQESEEASGLVATRLFLSDVVLQHRYGCIAINTTGTQLAIYAPEHGFLSLFDIVRSTLSDNTTDVIKRHVFKHGAVEVESKENEIDNSALRGLSYFVKKILYSDDGLYLAVVNAASIVYVYDLDL